MSQQHGGNILGYKDILDFSANINPLGSPESVKRTLLSGISSIEKYPDPFCKELRQSIAIYNRIEFEHIVCGNGADDIIFRLVHALKPQKAIILSPTFSEYSRALSEVNCEITEFILRENNDFIVNDEFIEAINESYDICFICNPNNPTGQIIPPDILHKISIKCEETGTYLVSDECFLDFMSNSARYSLSNFINDHSIIIKAFTKIYAMAGIRLGYAICGSEKIMNSIQNSGQFWSVSALSQLAGISALKNTEFINSTINYINDEKMYLLSELKSLNIRFYDSSANFILFKSDPALFEKMLKNGILLRNCENFSGLSNLFYRMAIRTHKENTIFINTLRRCLNG